MASTEVARGVHLVAHAHVNCYLIEGDGGLTLVDAGLPGVWYQLGKAIRQLGYRPADLRALVLTHAHFDHVGTARRLQERLDLPIWAHPTELSPAARPYSYAHENPRSIYPVRHPRAIPILLAMAGAGALWSRGVRSLLSIETGSPLEVPGTPVPVLSPGHTYGHVALHLPDRDVLLSGDALVTLDPYTAESGPRIIAGAATADSAMALDSLGALEGTGASTVLPGHGEPWTAGIGAAAARARATGPS